MRSCFVACLALIAALGCADTPALVGSYYHSVVAGKPFDPRAEPNYGQPGYSTRAWMALCLYEDDSYTYLTHRWNGPRGDSDEFQSGDFSRPTPDSMVFTGWFANLRGRIDGDQINVESGTHIFTKVDWITCPPKR